MYSLPFYWAFANEKKKKKKKEKQKGILPMVRPGRGLVLNWNQRFDSIYGLNQN